MSEEEIAHWTCPMHPSIKSHTKGACPLCGMDLIPVSKEEARSGAVLLDDERRQRWGVKTAPVERRALSPRLDALGQVVWDEGTWRDIAPRVEGQVVRLHVSRVGEEVKAGQPLLELVSDEVVAAQEEFLLARSGPPGLLEAARRRLRLLGMEPGQVAGLERSGKSHDALVLHAPVDGVVLEKMVVQGARLMPGERALRLGSLERLWVEAEVYEQDLGALQPGQAARVHVEALPGETWSATVAEVLPSLTGEGARAGVIRLAISDPKRRLRPGMLARVRLEQEAQPRLVIPREAVIHQGKRDTVFVDQGEGRLVPTDVELGARAEGWVEVTRGLKEGQRVVVSGQFLVAAESRLRAPAQEDPHDHE
jgi:Cu(I)/Ag(I) efflux system membrane fusion protein